MLDLAIADAGAQHRARRGPPRRRRPASPRRWRRATARRSTWPPSSRRARRSSPRLPRRARARRASTPASRSTSFVAGKANQLARAAGLQVAEHPTSYNPLFVYGGVGLGKTHLIQAIGNQILAAAIPRAKIRYIHAETYVSDVVRAYQHKAFDEFKRYYRSLDLLLIDDIQFFGGKSRTQEEFFYLFNTLIEAHKQVVITCDTYPKEIAGIEERLISRFGWGLTVALEPPELEMRVAILLAKAAAERRAARRAGRVLHRQAHPLQRARARRRAEARARLLELPRRRRSRWRWPRRRCATCSPCRTARSRSRTSRRPSPTTTRSASPTCTRRSARAPSRGRGRWRWRWPRSSRSCRCPRSAATSAAATTRRCCTPAARSPSCANRIPDFNHDVNFLLQVLRN